MAPIRGWMGHLEDIIEFPCMPAPGLNRESSLHERKPKFPGFFLSTLRVWLKSD